MPWTKIIWTVSTIAFVYLIVILLNRTFLTKIKGVVHKHQMRKLSYYIANIVIVIIILVVWIERIPAIATFFGIIGAGIFIALADIILSLGGWLFIIFRRPFQIGDRIEIGDISGDVIDVRLFQFSLLRIGDYQSTGKIMHIPNSFVFRREFTNQTMGFEYIWDEFSVVITFESDWSNAREILKSAIEKEDENIEKVRTQIRKTAKRFAIRYDKLTSNVYTTIEDFGIKLTLRYLVRPRRRRIARDLLSTEFLKAVSQQPDISLAYPTYRIVK